MAPVRRLVLEQRLRSTQRGAAGRLAHRVDAALWGASLLLYGAGLGLVSTALLLLAPAARLAGTLIVPRRADASPAASGAAAQTGSPAGAGWEGRPLAVYAGPLVFVAAAAASAVGSVAPRSAWGGVVLLALMVLAYGSATSLAGTGGRSTQALQLAFGGALLAAMSLDGFLRSRLNAETPFVGKNGVGTLLALALPLAQVATAGPGDPVLAWTTVLLVTAGLFLTMSQGGWVGAAAAQVVLVCLSSRRLRTRAAAFALMAVLLASGLALYLLDSQLPARQLLLSRLELGSSSKTERLLIWKAAWRMFLDHPWRGVGIGSFGVAYARYRLPEAREPEVSFAHNLVLNLLAETGVLGFGAFWLVVAGWVAAGVRALRAAAPEQRDMAAATLAALTALLVHQLFDGTMWSVHIGIGFWLLGAMLMDLAGSRPPERVADGG